MDYLVLVLLGFGALWGLGALLGAVFTEELCEACGNWGEANYMVVSSDGKFYHPSCYQPGDSVESPHSPSE
jgi:hypothetical protein